MNNGISEPFRDGISEPFYDGVSGGGGQGMLPFNGGRLSFTTPAVLNYFRVDTTDGSDWILNNKFVSSGVYHSLPAGQDYQYGLKIGGTAKSAYFWNDWNATDLALSLSDMATWALTGSAYFYNCPPTTGDISQTGWALTGSAYFYNCLLITGDISQTGWALTGSVSFHNCLLITGDISQTGWALTGYINLFNCSRLTTCSQTDLFPACKDFTLSGCSFNQSSVDNILQSAVNGGLSDGILQLDGGANAIPSSAGLSNKTTLEGRGWTVTVNS